MHRDAVNGVLRGRRGRRLTAITSGGRSPTPPITTSCSNPRPSSWAPFNGGFRHREPGWRHLPARQHLVPHPPRRGGAAPRRRRTRSAPNIPVLAGRSTGPNRGAFGRGVAVAAEDVVARLDDAYGARLCEEHLRFLGNPPQNRSSSTWLRRGPRLAPSRRGKRSSSSVSSTNPRDAARHPFAFGSRSHRAWGLALRSASARKVQLPSCRRPATEDAIVLSLSTAPQLPARVGRICIRRGVRPLLIQAMLDAPMFAARWPLDGTTSLALAALPSGKKVPPQLASAWRAEDLLAAVFPDQIACARTRGDARSPIIHWSIRPFTIASTRRWTSRTGEAAAGDRIGGFASSTAT